LKQENLNIVKIIKACEKANVSKITIGDIIIEFNKPNKTPVEEIMVEKDEKFEQEAIENQKEIDHLKEVIADENLILEDYDSYEEQQIKEALGRG
jgi:hypothetical protein